MRVWLQTRWKPIICPGCSKRFRINRKQWRKISAPPLVTVAAMLVFQMFGRQFVEIELFTVVLSILLGALVVVSIWWLYMVFSKLNFERYGT